MIPIRRFLPACTALAALAGGLRCNSEPSAPDLADVELTVAVTDSTGAAVPAVPLTVYAYHDTQQVYLALVYPTDALGVLRLTDTLAKSMGPVDSFVVSVSDMGGQCNAFPSQTRTVRRPAGTTRLRLDLDAHGSAPSTPVAGPGESCGIGLGIFSDGVGSAFWVQLNIDSITDSIRGAWKIDFQATIASLEGSLSGPVRSDSLLLAMGSISFGPPICTPSFRLSGAIQNGATQGLMYLAESTACGWNYPSKDSPFWLVPFDMPSFP
jgi:hypothetical protein